MNQILEGIAKANGTPNELDQGYVHARSSQAPTIEEHLPSDDTGPSQARNAPPQSPPSTILAFGTSIDTSNMGTQDNSTTELPHTLAANLLVFMAKLWETKDVD
ncbi:unnamed protein product [Sphagnum balticum]